MLPRRGIYKMITEMYKLGHLHVIKLYNIDGRLIANILYDTIHSEYDVSDEVEFTIKTYKVG